MFVVRVESLGVIEIKVHETVKALLARPLLGSKLTIKEL